LLTGLLPGLHPNSAGVILIQTFGPVAQLPVVLIILLGLHTVLEFLPSIFFGVPESETEVAVLPGRRMFFEGKAQEAVMICAVSAVLSAIGALVISPVAIVVLPSIFAIIHPLTGWLLALAVAALLLSEGKDGKKDEGGRKTNGKLKSSVAIRARRVGLALVVFVLASALGALALGGPMADPLLAMFVGFFTMPSLLGMGEHAGEKKGESATIQHPVKMLKLDFLPYVVAGLVLGGLADLLPGISTPAQIAVFASLLVPIEDARHFLALVSSIASSHAALALTAAASIGVSRVGAVALANSIVPIQPTDLPLMMGAFVLSIGIGALVMMQVGKALSAYWKELDLVLLGRILAVYLVGVVALTDGMLGLAVLATATAIGLLPMWWGVRRTHVMGAIIGPSLMRAFWV
jgi:putative membrane protein